MPRRSRWRLRTRALGVRWARFVTDAVDAEDRFHAAVRRLEKGPLRDRLRGIGDDVATAVEQTWQVAASGQDLTDAREAIDVGEILTELGRVDGAAAEARRRQLEIAKRIDQRLAATERHLGDLDARLDEVVTRTLEFGATQQIDALASIGTAVDGVVAELQHLSAGLAELPSLDDPTLDPMALGRPDPSMLPGPPATSGTASPDATHPGAEEAVGFGGEFEGTLPEDPLPDPQHDSTPADPHGPGDEGGPPSRMPPPDVP
jgi:hypothetical protein